MASRLDGLIAARKAFARIPEAHRDAINDTNFTTASEIVRAAKARVRVRSGLLQRNIGFSQDKRRGTAKVGIEKGPAFYGHFLEFGTVRMAARPFMLPSVEEQRALHEQRLMAAGRQIEKDVSNVGGRFL